MYVCMCVCVRVPAQFLVSLEERVQCYRRCVPMAECKKDMVTEQLTCMKNEQLAIGNSKLVGCAMVCCQWDECNLEILVEADMYINNCTNYLGAGNSSNFTCQGSDPRTKGAACIAPPQKGAAGDLATKGDLTLKEKIGDLETCQGNDAVCAPTPCVTFTGDFKAKRKESSLNYGFVYRESDGKIIDGCEEPSAWGDKSPECVFI